jgi:predicted nucleotidyltransferase
LARGAREPRLPVTLREDAVRPFIDYLIGQDAPESVGAVRVIMNTMSEVAESSAVLDDVVRRIAERFSPDKIILFGSCARGDAGPDSDIDLLVLFSDVADPNKRAAELYASLVDFPRPMDIVVSTSSRFERYRNVVNTVYWPASREGKVLYERAARGC